MDLNNWVKVDKGNTDTLPDNFKKIEMTDGKITDTGFQLGVNWYLNSHSRTIGEITHWRYV